MPRLSTVQSMSTSPAHSGAETIVSDRELFLEVQMRNKNAMQELSRRYAPGLRDYLLRSNVSDEEADSVLEKIFNQICCRASSFDPDWNAEVREWIYSTARNLCEILFPRAMKTERA